MLMPINVVNRRDDGFCIFLTWQALIDLRILNREEAQTHAAQFSSLQARAPPSYIKFAYVWKGRKGRL